MESGPHAGQHVRTTPIAQMGGIKQQEVVFRAMESSDIPAGLRLCRAAHWNQTARDWEHFIALSPAGCRVAARNGRVIGTVATVRYEERFSWIGMVLVDPPERGRGIGAMLMTQAIGGLEDIPSIRLDATPAGHAVYRKLEFIDEYQLIRMEASGQRPDVEYDSHPARPMNQRDLPSIAEFDRRVFGADRHRTLAWMLDGAPEYAWIIEQNGFVSGYAFGRHGFNFEHIGPVIARDRETAQALASACLSRTAEKRVILDAPRHDDQWSDWLQSIGFREQRPFIRMYRGGNPFPGLPENQFAILGPEFG